MRKWNSNEPSALQHVPLELRDSRSIHSISDSQEYTKALGIEWNVTMDHFRLTVAKLSPLGNITKRTLISDIAKIFDVLGWFSPSVIKMKILLQQLWELKVDWDDPAPSPICDVWIQWRSKLESLSDRHIPRCYFPKGTQLETLQLHGFCDASEQAYTSVIYLRVVGSDGKVHVTLVTSKTKVAPIKRLTIPRLELCGALLLAQLLHHVKELFHVSLSSVYTWSDSTIVLNWLIGNPRRFKTYVSNRVSQIMDLIAPDRWSHVSGFENPADCASRGLFPSELLNHELWWSGPGWLYLPSSDWPKQPSSQKSELCDKEISLHVATHSKVPIIPMDRFSSFTRLKRVTAWMFRFINHCRTPSKRQSVSYLTTEELVAAEAYWLFCCHSQTILQLRLKPSKRNVYPIQVVYYHCIHFWIPLVCFVWEEEFRTQVCSILVSTLLSFTASILSQGLSFIPNIYACYMLAPLHSLLHLAPVFTLLEATRLFVPSLTSVQSAGVVPSNLKHKC